jgi:hypothetical protein
MPPDAIDTIEEIMVQGLTILDANDDDPFEIDDFESYAPSLQTYRNHVEWWAIRNDPDHPDRDPKLHDLESISDDYIQRLRSLLEGLDAGPNAAGALPEALGDGSFSDFLASQQVFEAAMRSQLLFGANLDAHDLGNVLGNLPEEYAYFENTTYVNGTANSYVTDGRLWPIIRVDYEANGGSEAQLYFDAPNEHLAVAFKPWRMARELSHIDFRLRRMAQQEVLAEYRAVENDSGEIAFGHTFDLTPFVPDGPSSDSFVVHAVPVDSANHPSRGSCAFVYLKWVSQSAGDDHSLLAEPMPPFPMDPICDDYGMDGFARIEDIPPRNIYLESSANPSVVSHRVVPDRIFIGTSGETVQITNLDNQQHRYVTTNNFQFGIVGSTEIDGPSTATDAQRYLDTGVMKASSEVILQLPVDNDDPLNGDDVPSPYWFNLVEVTASGEPIEGSPPIQIIYQNPACL